MSGSFMNNQQNSRFEYHQDGLFSFANYRIDGDTLYIDYVESPHALRGTGAASKLMSKVVDFAQDNSLEITPICGYAATWLQRHQRNDT